MEKDNISSSGVRRSNFLNGKSNVCDIKPLFEIGFNEDQTISCLSLS